MNLSKTEEAFCNGVLFSISRLVAPSIQEGELENAQYYVYVLLTPAIDKLVIKIWKAPEYSSIQIKGKDVETFTIDIYSKVTEEEAPFTGYTYGEKAYSDKKDAEQHLISIYCNKAFSDGGIYDGLMIYPAIKCMMTEIIKNINRKNQLWEQKLQTE